MSETNEGRPPLAWVLLGLFGALTAAGLAFVPFRSLPPGLLLLEQIYAVLAGASVAVLLAESERLGDGVRILLVLLLGSGLLLGLAVRLGAPFGSLLYTPNLGPRIAGLVPLGVPFLWTAVVGGALAASRSLQGPPSGRWREALRLCVAAATLATLVATSLDPVARHLRLWTYGVRGSFHGVPFVSFIGWWSTALVLGVAVFTFAPRARLLRRSAPPGPILVLFLLQLLVLGIAVRARLWIALCGGFIAALLLLAAWIRALAGAGRISRDGAVFPPGDGAGPLREAAPRDRSPAGSSLPPDEPSLPPAGEDRA